MIDRPDNALAPPDACFVGRQEKSCGRFFRSGSRPGSGCARRKCCFDDALKQLAKHRDIRLRHALITLTLIDERLRSNPMVVFATFRRDMFDSDLSWTCGEPSEKNSRSGGIHERRHATLGDRIPYAFEPAALPDVEYLHFSRVSAEHVAGGGWRACRFRISGAVSLRASLAGGRVSRKPNNKSEIQ